MCHGSMASICSSSDAERVSTAERQAAYSSSLCDVHRSPFGERRHFGQSRYMGSHTQRAAYPPDSPGEMRGTLCRIELGAEIMFLAVPGSSRLGTCFLFGGVDRRLRCVKSEAANTAGHALRSDDASESTSALAANSSVPESSPSRSSNLQRPFRPASMLRSAVTAPIQRYSPWNSSPTETFSAVDKVCTASSDGLAPPVSIRDMYVRAKPHLSANSSCDRPVARRRSRMR